MQDVDLRRSKANTPLHFGAQLAQVSEPCLPPDGPGRATSSEDPLNAPAVAAEAETLLPGAHSGPHPSSDAFRGWIYLVFLGIALLLASLGWLIGWVNRGYRTVMPDWNNQMVVCVQFPSSQFHKPKCPRLSDSATTYRVAYYKARSLFVPCADCIGPFTVREEASGLIILAVFFLLGGSSTIAFGIWERSAGSPVTRKLLGVFR